MVQWSRLQLTRQLLCARLTLPPSGEACRPRSIALAGTTRLMLARLSIPWVRVMTMLNTLLRAAKPPQGCRVALTPLTPKQVRDTTQMNPGARLPRLVSTLVTNFRTVPPLALPYT